MRDSRF